MTHFIAKHLRLWGVVALAGCLAPRAMAQTTNFEPGALYTMANGALFDQSLAIDDQGRAVMRHDDEKDPTQLWQLEKSDKGYRLINPFKEVALHATAQGGVVTQKINDADGGQWWAFERNNKLFDLKPSNQMDCALNVGSDNYLQLLNSKNYMLSRSLFFGFNKSIIPGFAIGHTYRIVAYGDQEVITTAGNKEGAAPILGAPQDDKDAAQLWVVDMAELNKYAFKNVASQLYWDNGGDEPQEVQLTQHAAQKGRWHQSLFELNPVAAAKGYYRIIPASEEGQYSMYGLVNGKLQLVDYDPQNKAGWFKFVHVGTHAPQP